MGAKLIALFNEAEQKAGMQGKIRLAMKTAMSSEQAATLPDTPENVTKVQNALNEL